MTNSTAIAAGSGQPSKISTEAKSSRPGSARAEKPQEMGGLPRCDGPGYGLMSARRRPVGFEEES